MNKLSAFSLLRSGHPVRTGTTKSDHIPIAEIIQGALLGLVLAAGISASGAQTVELPLNHWVYEYLERLHTRHLLPAPGHILPWSRLQVAEQLAALEKGDAAAGLTGVEKKQMEILKREFCVELGRLDPEKAGPDGWSVFKDHWGIWQDTGNYLALDYVFRTNAHWLNGDTYGDSLDVYQISTGGNIWGYLQDRVGFQFYGVDTKEISSVDYEYGNPANWLGEHHAGFTNVFDSGAVLYFDRTNAQVSLDLPWFRVAFGKGQTHWGPGRYGSLSLSGDAVELDHMELSASYGQVRFTALHGKCFENMLDSVRTEQFGPDVYREKYLAAHRVEVDFPKNIVLGIHEVLVYADRGMELAYLNPIMFYWSAEHFLNDQDNSTIGADLSVRTVKNLHLYGELFLDDLTFDSLGTAWFGNKWAYTVGGRYTDPPYLANTDFLAEYTRVEPWVYTHRFGIGAYTHQGVSLGHRIGPNADLLSLEARYQPLPQVSCRLVYSRERQGENYFDPSDSSWVDIGGDIRVWHTDSTNAQKNFLTGGEVEKTTVIGGEVTVRAWYPFMDRRVLSAFRDLSLTVGYYRIGRHNVPTGNDIITRGDRNDSRFSMELEYHFY